MILVTFESSHNGPRAWLISISSGFAHHVKGFGVFPAIRDRRISLFLWNLWAQSCLPEAKKAPFLEADVRRHGRGVL